MEKVHDTIIFAKNVVNKVNQDHVRAHSAEAAFFLMMCFFPLLMLLITMLKYTSVTPGEIINMVEEITPFDVRDLLEPILDSIYNQTIALVSGTVIAAIWTVGKGVLGMADGLNTIYRIEETRNYFVTRLWAAVYMVALVIAIGVSAVIMVMGYGFSGFVSEKITLLSFLPDFSTIIPALIAMVVLTVLFLFMYSYLPNHRMKMSGQLPGAIFASVAWSLFSFIFSIYLDFSTNMSVLYGSLTTLVAIMLWLYVCMYLWFIGAEINHYLAAPELFSPDMPAPWEKSTAQG
ncbi:MAG: YihY/virulence factor BrkB family protein [Lachnospiraceae bacterium]|nr:YihY/virulence factor BrkB family protein [Lachnospiraceae bacterium]